MVLQSPGKSCEQFLRAPPHTCKAATPNAKLTCRHSVATASSSCAGGVGLVLRVWGLKRLPYRICVQEAFENLHGFHTCVYKVLRAPSVVSWYGAHG